MLGGLLGFAGAVAALWLVRERDIERGETLEPERVEIERGAGARRGVANASKGPFPSD